MLVKLAPAFIPNWKLGITCAEAINTVAKQIANVIVIFFMVGLFLCYAIDYKTLKLDLGFKLDSCL